MNFQNKHLMKTNGKRVIKVIWLTTVAAREGSFDLLKWCWRRGCCPVDDDLVCEGLAGVGDTDALEWVAENMGVKLNGHVYVGASRKGKLNVMEWAKKRGIPFLRPTCMIYDPLQLSLLASSGGHLDCIKWMVENIV